ncbi:hypothetical protein [Actinomycetospora atypica]|uniref:Uncharacterized protein n=1 Tax=Actinomycetospora atypica TaxID=1290095 RepID=A0ABV9YFW6_9PSEU
MTVLWRALWSSPHGAAVERVDRVAVAWAEEVAHRHAHHLPGDGSRVRASDEGRFVLVRDTHADPADPEITAAVRLDVVDTRDDGRRTHTRVRSWRGPGATAEGGRAWVWVDVEGPGGLPPVPEFVPDLLAGTDAGRHGVALRASVSRCRRPDPGSPDRDVPLVLIGLPDDAPPAAVRRIETAAHRTARAVAGLASVVLVGSRRPGPVRIDLPHGEPSVELPADPACVPEAVARVVVPRSVRLGVPASWAGAGERLGPRVPDELVEKVAEAPTRGRYPFDPR